jgi:hypothetical protein
MAVSNKFGRMKETKTAIATAMRSKGIDVKDSHTFREYADLIKKIDVTQTDYDPDSDMDDIESGTDPSGGTGGGGGAGAGSTAMRYVGKPGVFNKPEDNGKIHYPNGTSEDNGKRTSSTADHTGTSDSLRINSEIKEIKETKQTGQDYLSAIQEAKNNNKTTFSGAAKAKKYISDTFDIDASGFDMSQIEACLNQNMPKLDTDISDLNSQLRDITDPDAGIDYSATGTTEYYFNSVTVDINPEDIEDTGDGFTVVYCGLNGEPLQTCENVPRGGSAPAFTGKIPTNATNFEQFFGGWNPMPINVHRSMRCMPIMRSASISSEDNPFYVQTNGSGADTDLSARYNDIHHKEITDSWEEIVKHPENYENGQWKILPFVYPIPMSIRATRNGHGFDGYYSGITYPGLITYVGGRGTIRYGAVGYLRMMKVCEGEDNTASTWVSIDGLSRTPDNDEDDLTPDTCLCYTDVHFGINAYNGSTKELCYIGPTIDGDVWEYNNDMYSATGFFKAPNAYDINRMSFTYDGSWLQRWLCDELPKGFPNCVASNIKPVHKMCVNKLIYRDISSTGEEIPPVLLNRMGGSESLLSASIAKKVTNEPYRVWALSKREASGYFSGTDAPELEEAITYDILTEIANDNSDPWPWNSVSGINTGDRPRLKQCNALDNIFDCRDYINYVYRDEQNGEELWYMNRSGDNPSSVHCMNKQGDPGCFVFPRIGFCL